jgi:hypothetical protein
MASPDSELVLPRAAIVDTDPSSSFVCDYVAGVNRVLGLPPYVLVDNIGRNVELWCFEPGATEPLARARYDQTSYPGDQGASLLDVDIHAAFLRRNSSELLTVNHFGRVRRFALPMRTGRLMAAGELQLLGDVERVVLAGDCFIGSSPRGEHTDDRARPGLFLFEPIHASFETSPGDVRRLAWKQVMADWGVVTALAVSADATRLAVAAGARLGVFDLVLSRSGVRLGACRQESALSFNCQWLHLEEDGRVWAAGHRRSADADGEAWDACRGGEINAWAGDTCARDVAVDLPDATAWGYGADPIVPAPGCRQIYVLGRDASLHVVEPRNHLVQQLYRPSEAAAEAPSLGIGHAAIHAGWLYAGFSRGGFRLWRYAVTPD